MEMHPLNSDKSAGILKKKVQRNNEVAFNQPLTAVEFQSAVPRPEK